MKDRNRSITSTVILAILAAVAPALLMTGCNNVANLEIVSAQSSETQMKGRTQISQVALDSPEAAAQYLWQTILTQCQVPGSASPISFYGQPATPRGKGVIYEFRDPWTKILPSRALDAADRLNGLQFTGVAILVRLASTLGPFRRFDLAHPKLLILK